ncbi:MAG: serine--tRNA ligase [Planctomycetota bacterium]
MLDKNDLTEHVEDYQTRLATRDSSLSLDEVVALNARRKELQKQRDDLVHEARGIGPQIAQAKQQGEDASALLERSTAIKEQQKELEQALKQAEDELDQKLLLIPNLPHPEAPLGGEDDGVIRRTEGTAPSFAFEPKDHVALCEATGMVELGQRATKLTKSSFVVFMDQGARLVRALINFFLDLHTTDHGYTEVCPPFLVNETTLTGTGQLPKFAEDMFTVCDGLFLIPTAEVPLTNLHQDEILAAKDLPLSYCAYTPCFRREAGSAGKMTRGLKRLHQFDKVELVRFVRPEESDAEHQLLLSHCEEPLKRLGLHYRIKELATGDIGFSAARCFDIEAWAPGSKEWLEVSSVSVFTDYQARRAKIRFKDAPAPGQKKGKTQFVHTLNGSGLALPRVIVTLLETYQQEDGTIRVPEALVPYVGLEVLGA